MITLGATVLNPHMVWEDKAAFSPVAQEVRRTLGGELAVFHSPLQAGRPITLVSLPDQGWLDKTQVDAVQAMADIPGGTYALTIGAESFTVMFRHQEAPAFEATPLIARGIPLAGDWFVCTIKLMTV